MRFHSLESDIDESRREASPVHQEDGSAKGSRSSREIVCARMMSEFGKPAQLGVHPNRRSRPSPLSPQVDGST